MMGRPDKADWLDEAILQTVPGDPPKTDFAAWRTAHAGALESLRLRAQKRAQCASMPRVIELVRRIMRSPITRFAVAAALIVAVFVLSRHLAGREATPPKPQPQVAEKMRPAEAIRPQPVQDAPEAELAAAWELFEQRDIAGLVALLETGEPETRIRVAGYLGRVGDASALAALQGFADRWEGTPENNPYRVAIGAIQERLSESDRSQSEPEEAARLEPNIVSAAPSVPARMQTGVTGFVVEKLTQKPVKGALVGAKYSDPNALVETDEHGRFSLTDLKPSERHYVYVLADGYISQRIATRVVGGRVIEGVCFELDPASRVAGTVADPDGDPIGGATVKTFHFTNRPQVTGLDGRFEIDGLNPVVDSYSLHATHPDYPAVSLQFSPAAVGRTVVVDVTLRPGVDVHGTVTDARGDPVEGATVGTTTSGAMWNCITARTDSQGQYRLDNVETGKLVVWAIHDKHAPHVQHSQLVGAGAEERIDIQLPAARNLPGQVLDRAGETIPEAIVVIDEYDGVRNLDRRWHRCDPNGRFTIPNAPTTGDLTLRVFGGPVSGTDYRVDLSADECIITVARDGNIYGAVVDAATGAPIPKFTVKMTATEVGRQTYGYSAMWSREGHTFDSSGGLFDTRGDDLPVGGEYRMTVFAEGYDPLTIDPIVVQPVSDDPNRTVFRLSTATLLAGQVVDEMGEPVEDAMVALFSKSERHEPRHWRRVTTDASGVFVLSGVGGAQRYLYVSAPGFAPHYGLTRDLETTEAAPARIVLNAGAAVFGTVVDESGAELSGFRICVQRSHSQATRLADYPYPVTNKETRTDADGRYEMSGLPTGWCTVRVVSSAGETLAVKRREFMPAEPVRIDFGNEEGHTVTGTVRQGATVLADARVGLYASNNDSKHTRTDALGRFRLNGMPSGRTRVVINWTDAESSDQSLGDRREIRIDGDIDLDLDLGGDRVAAMIPPAFRGREGLAVSVRRRADGPETEGGELHWENDHDASRTGVLKPDGWFECEGLRAGEYYLILREHRRVLGITDVFTIAGNGETQNVEFRLGQGQLIVTVLDAQTRAEIGGAYCAVDDDREWGFTGNWAGATEAMRGATTDGSGRARFTGLPSGQYVVSARADGYLWSTSEFVAVQGSGVAHATVALAPAAMAGFELSQGLRSLVDTDSVMIKCRVTDLSTGAPVLVQIGTHRSEEHNVTLSLEEPRSDYAAQLRLPAGRYRIDYVLRPYNTARNTVRMPVHEGTFTVELVIGQTTTVRLDY